MKQAKLRKLGFTKKELDAYEISAINFIEDSFFHRKDISSYREEAIKFCVENKVSFHNTQNNSYEVLGKFVKVFCPVCNKEMESSHGSGNGSVASRGYKCKKCGVEADLTIPIPYGISFRFRDDEDE